MMNKNVRKQGTKKCFLLKISGFNHGSSVLMWIVFWVMAPCVCRLYC